MTASLAGAQDQAASTAETETGRIPAVHEIMASRQDLQEFLFSLGDIATASFIAGPTAQIAELREQLEPISNVVAGGVLDDLSLDALLDLEIDIRAEIADLDALSAGLTARARLRDSQLDELTAQRRRWGSLVAAAEEREAPIEVLAIADSAIDLLDRTETVIKEDRDAVLGVLGGILDLQLDAAAFNRAVRGRRQGLEASSQLASGLPLWSPQVAITPQQLSAARATFAGFARSIRDYLATNGLAALLWLVGSSLITLWLLRAGRVKVGGFIEADASTDAMVIFNQPGAAALLVGFLGILSFAPPAPVAVTNVLIALLPWPAARLATMVFAKPLRVSVYVLAGALSIVALRPVYEVLPLAARTTNLVLTLAVSGAFYLDLKRGNWQRALTSVRELPLRLGVLCLCAILLAILLIDVLGYVGVANTARTLVLGGLGYGLIFIVLCYVLNSLILAVLQTQALAKLSTVRHSPWAIVRVLRKLINTIAVISWFTLTLNLSGLSGRVWGVAEEWLAADLAIGAVSFRAASLLAGAFVIWLTWLMYRGIRFVMANRALDYQSAATGLSFALSKVLGYAIVVAGFLLAISAMGFDITRVTVLAGALGVGIGLGLQNIANNFVSGIILLFERPVQVNDIAKVDTTLGTIKEIGIRSTVLQTFDGAEVIVPNADFMAKTVLNWTKSNRFRRAEIDLGVAYGTDTKQVLDILNSAARAHGDVLEDPEPFATFTGFGDSSLNFRLYVWLSDLANFLLVPSAIRQDILTRLQQAEIEIPFPQRDVRVTMSGGADRALTTP